MSADISDIDARTVFIKTRTMFKLKGWNIVRTGFLKEDALPECYAVHGECKLPYGNVPTRSYHPIRRNVRFRCGDAVPDEMQALIKLHNWKT